MRTGAFIAITVPGDSLDPDDRAGVHDGEHPGAEWYTFRSAVMITLSGFGRRPVRSG